MRSLEIYWSKFKHTIRKNHFAMGFFKKLAQLPVFRSINKKLSPPTERFDRERADSELAYVGAYSAVVLKNILQEKKSNKSVLDIGCGYGYVTEMIAEQDSVSHVTAIDKIKPTEFRVKSSKISYEMHDITKLALEQNQLPMFDVIVSTEFIEHISEGDAKNLLRWIYGHLISGGLFTGSTPINKTEFQQFSGSPFHVREYSIKDFTELLFNAGFHSISTEEHSDFFSWKAYK